MLSSQQVYDSLRRCGRNVMRTQDVGGLGVGAFRDTDGRNYSQRYLRQSKEMEPRGNQLI